MSWFSSVVSVALPVVAIVAPEVIPIIGETILGETAGAAAAQAAGAAAISAGATLASGGSVEDATKAGAAAGGGGYVASSLGGGVQGSAAGGATATAIKGGSGAEIITNAAASGAGAAIADATGSKVAGVAAATAISGGDPNAVLYTMIGSYVKDTLSDTSKTDAQKAEQIQKAAVSNGISNDQIAAALGIDVNTVNSYLAQAQLPATQAGAGTQVADLNIAGYTPPEGATVSDAGPGRMTVTEVNPNDPNDKRTYDVVKDPTTGAISYESTSGDPTQGQNVTVVSSKIQPIFDWNLPPSKTASLSAAKSNVGAGGKVSSADASSDTSTAQSGVSGVDSGGGTTFGGITGGGGAGGGTGGGTGNGGGGTGGAGGGIGVEVSTTETTPTDKTTTDETKFTTDPSVVVSPVNKNKSSVLYPTLSGFASSPLQQALGAYTPPGQVESESTGKPRQNVWNEASLRLKDALGV
jgi:hypothetical protein